MSATTFDLFFTGRDDPRDCILIGEDTKPIYFCFETPERGLMSSIRTTLYKNNRDMCALFDWTPGNHLGSATMGSRRQLMSHFVLPGSVHNARAFKTADGQQFEWRRCLNNPSSYDLFSPTNKQIAAFRRYSHLTTVGPSHALLQYTFTNENLLIEALLALCLNRWIDQYGI